MSIINDRSEICKIYHGSVEICKVYHGATPVFGCAESPTVLGIVRDYSGGTYQFVVEDFTNGFSDPNGDTYLKTTIETLPSVGIIKYSGTPITPGFEFNLTDVGNLTFEFEAGYVVTEGGYCITGGSCFSMARLKFQFKTSDDSTTMDYSNTANFAFNLTKGNTRPTVSDNQGNLVALEYTFQEASFTKDFTDPEGQGYKNVIIKSLPLQGTLEYSGSPITIDFQFLATDSANLKLVIDDSYASYSGALYKFSRSIDDIIAEQERLGFKLNSNEVGSLKFVNDSGDVNIINGTLIEEPLRFNFVTTDDSYVPSESNEAVFTLIPTGDINVKGLYVNKAPTVGDNEFNI